MRYLCWIFVFFLVTSCEQEVQTPIDRSLKDKTVIIEGKINGYDPDTWPKGGTYAIVDYTTASRKAVEFPIDSLGNYRLEFSTNHPTDIYLFNGYSTYLLVHPGDRMTTTFDAVKDDISTFLKNSTITGDHAAENKAYLSYLSEIQFSYNTYDDQEKLRSDSAEAYKRHLDSISTLKEAIIDKYVRQSADKPSFKNWLLAEKLISKKQPIMSYTGMYRMFTGQEQKVSDTFYEGVEPIAEVTLPLLINSNLSDSFNNEYLFYIRAAVSKAHPEAMKTRETFDLLFTRAIIDRNKDNLLLGQLLVNRWANMGMEQMSVAYYESQRSTIDSLLKGSSFGSKLTARYHETKERIENPLLPEGTEILAFSEEKPEDYLKEIIANAKGKVIYIDNWATWCAPCRSEFEMSTPALKKKFEKDVEFVYFCHKSDKALWKPVIAEFQVTGKHYFIEQHETAPIAQQINLQGYPTYTIINKKGEIVHSGFEFRPSEPITTEILNELIAE
jgi:thiol-disulfide isomerase/thioredoxin